MESLSFKHSGLGLQWVWILTMKLNVAQEETRFLELSIMYLPILLNTWYSRKMRKLMKFSFLRVSGSHHKNIFKGKKKSNHTGLNCIRDFYKMRRLEWMNKIWWFGQGKVVSWSIFGEKWKLYRDRMIFVLR